MFHHLEARQELNLKGFSFQELFHCRGLERLDQTFLSYLKARDQTLYEQLLRYREKQLTSPTEVSHWIVRCGSYLEQFMAELFAIEKETTELNNAIIDQDPIFSFKQHYVLRQARRSTEVVPDFFALNLWLDEHLIKNNLDEDKEFSVAKLGIFWLKQPELYAYEIAQLTAWCVAAMTTALGQEAVKNWVSFKLPTKLNFENLVPNTPVPDDTIGRLEAPPETQRLRAGFALTDPRMTQRQALNEMHYCVYCHKTDGDFCSKGFPIKKTNREFGLKVNPLGEVLTGCPLEQKISEMNYLKKSGFSIAALAAVMIDNPTCPATGHRICNDCMKACIYQKQDPVDIPQAESRILTDILDLPWGVEIYDLLTRWNPLRSEQWLPKPYNGLKVLIMGMGPAGFTLAHYLLMEGFAVVGCDGLKIEPLSKDLYEQPIHRYQDLTENLEHRVMAGFGGVAEYGITVRWDKNFLKLIYLNLMRRSHFQVFGSVRFGGTLTVEQAWELGFDHLAIAVGAGLPREIAIPNSLAPGMRQANDFLMALQLTGAAKESSLANLQVRLPAVIIGGGLTGIDTATETQAYYIAQVEKIDKRYHLLANHFGEEVVRSHFNTSQLKILDEFLGHARRVNEERHQAKLNHQAPNFLKLIREWGGVTVAYRKMMQESPAYRRNPEEVTSALKEGIYYAEGLDPQAVVLDEDGFANALRCKWRILDEVGNWLFTDEEQTLPARSIFVATGAKPNIAYEFEHRGTFERAGFDYQRYEINNQQLTAVKDEGHVKMAHFGPFTNYNKKHHRVTFLGDTHPIFHGSVVNAIASAKRTYPQISQSLQDYYQAGDENEYQKFRQSMEFLFTAKVHEIKRLGPQMVQLKIFAPLAARNFYPGQFYRLQNYETRAAQVGHTRLQMEALALEAIYDEKEPNILQFIVFEKGASSRLVATLQVGEPVALMGPTGARSKIPNNENVLIIGDSMAAVHLLSCAPALKAAGNRILFMGIHSHDEPLVLKNELEAVCDFVFWTSDKKCGNFLSSLKEMMQDHSLPIPLEQVNLVFVVGKSQLLREVQDARNQGGFFSAQTIFQGSVYGPMQCMMKGVCAQCLQWQIDPQTGKRTKAVYACSWQTQPMDIIDIDNIDERLGQNQMQEILTNLWLDYLFKTQSINKV